MNKSARTALALITLAIVAFAAGIYLLRHEFRDETLRCDPNARNAYQAAQAHQSEFPHATENMVSATSIEIIQSEFPKDPDSMISAIEFFSVLARKASGNFIFSPASLRKAMALLNLGSGGNTKRQISRAMHFPKDAAAFLEHWRKVQERMNTLKHSKNISFENADALFIQKKAKLEKAYLSPAQKVFGAMVMPVDFMNSATLPLMNNWVTEKTRGLIKNAISPDVLRPDTSFILLDTLYFKGVWACLFPKDRTKAEPFFPSSGKREMVQMMHNEAHYQYTDNALVQILEMPYAEGLSMIIVLPRKKIGLAGLFRQIDGKALGILIREMEEQMVEVALPKFDIDSRFDLTESCRTLGIKDAFDPAAADLTSLSKEKGLSISAIEQVGAITVDEEGSEAAAMTMIAIAMDHSPPPEFVKFTADHPFAFLIQETKSGTVLFMGRVENPASK